MDFLIPQQSEAEHDQYLLDCFYDADFVTDLISKNLTIVAGRKGTGKTALAKFFQARHEDYGIDFCHRFSVDEFSSQFNGQFGSTLDEVTEVILFYILTRTVQLLMQKKAFSDEYTEFWQDFLTQNGLQSVQDYKAFVEVASQHEWKVNLKLTKGENTKERERCKIANRTGYLFDSLIQSLLPDKKILIFIDDLTDYLDRVDREKLVQEIGVVGDILLRLDRYNAFLRDNGKQMSFVSCIRDDLWHYVEGSNINKLKRNSLKMDWDEKSFCCLLIKRLPFFNDKEEAMKTPEASICRQFPNKIFSGVLSDFNTKRYVTNFYAYMMAISFNRPRDFLQFSYAMRDRLSIKKPIEFKSIESAEMEYSDYFIGEVRDELSITSKMVGLEDLETLIYYLGKKESFGYSELKTVVSKNLKKVSRRMVVDLLKDLWLYGVIGLSREKKKGIHDFNYMRESERFLVEEEMKGYNFCLHRGLMWRSKRSD